MNDSNVVNDIPMKAVAFKQESKGKTRPNVILREIPPVMIEISDAKTFGELYVSLVRMKMNLLSLGIFEDVDITMDVPDFPTHSDTDVMVRLNMKESRPLHLGIQGSVTTTGNDAGIEGSVEYVNPTGNADLLSGKMRYDVFRGNTLYDISYRIPKCFFNNNVTVNYSKDCHNLIKESSVNSLSEGISCGISSPSGLYSAGYSLTWRDLSPAADLDVERVFHSHCSKSMINECRPSLKSTIFSVFAYGSFHPIFILVINRSRQHQEVWHDFSYSGFIGDVNQLKAEATLASNFTITPDILGETGIALHFTGYGGFIKNLNRRKTRYFDRFFLSGEHIRGYDMSEIGPRSSPEDGGRKEGDILGGDRCTAVGAAISFPVAFSRGNSIGIRGQLFYNIGNIWERNTNLKRVYDSALQSYGVGITIPFGNVGKLELNYSVAQKRFNFLFCAM